MEVLELLWSPEVTKPLQVSSCQVQSRAMYQSVKFMSAGADIKEMEHLGFKDVFSGNFLSHWNRLSRTAKPVIAAVNGFAVSFEYMYIQF